MTKEERIKELLKGALDLHIHADPSFMARSCNAMEAAEECCRAGMVAIGVKDHHVSTALGAYFVNKYMHRAGGNPFTCYGSITLNNAVGFNPRAVFAALKLGAKIVFLPTIAAPAHIAMLSGNSKKGDAHFIKQKIQAKPEEPMPILDQNGELIPEIVEIMDIIKDADAVLCTGHVDYDECLAVAKRAKEIGLERLSYTHLPHFTTLDYDKLDKIVELGGYVEANLCLMASMTPPQVRMNEDQFCEMIRHFTPERCTMVSDAGGIAVPRPVDYISEGIGILIDHGFTDDEIRLMVRDNPAKLIGYEF